MAYVRNPVVYVPDLTNGRPIVDGKVYLLTSGTIPPMHDSTIDPLGLLTVTYINEVGNTVEQPQPLYTSKGGCLYGNFPDAARQFMIAPQGYVFAAYNRIGELQYSAETSASDYVETDALAAVGSTVLVGGAEAGDVGAFILNTDVLADSRPAITKLTVGDEVLSSPAIRDAVVVGSTITGLTDSHAFADRTIIDSFSDGGTYGTFDATTKYAHTSGTANHLYTFQGRGQKAGAGNLDNYCSFYSQPTLSGGTVVDHHHFRAYDNAGTSAITNQHAIHIRPLTSASNNYAIFSWGETPSIHVGKFTVGTFTTDTTAAVAAVSKINMTGINQYGFKSDCGANSAALTSYSAYMARVNLGGTGYTLPIGSGLMIEDANLAGGTTLTAQYGLYVKNQTKGGVNAAMRLDVTKGSNKWNLYATSDADNYLKGNLGIDVFVPSARLEIRASQSGSELAPIKLQAGALLPTPQNGAIEFDGTNLYFTAGGVRKTVTLV